MEHGQTPSGQQYDDYRIRDIEGSVTPQNESPNRKLLKEVLKHCCKDAEVQLLTSSASGKKWEGPNEVVFKEFYGLVRT